MVASAREEYALMLAGTNKEEDRNVEEMPVCIHLLMVSLETSDPSDGRK